MTSSTFQARANLSSAAQDWAALSADPSWPKLAKWVGQDLGWFEVVGQIFPPDPDDSSANFLKVWPRHLAKLVAKLTPSPAPDSFSAWWPQTVRALCHSSFAFDYAWVGESNERLEFLGDSVLQMLLSEIFYAQYPHAPEGDLSRWRSAAVNARVWEKMAYLLKIDAFLLVGKSNQEHISANMLADAWEAFWGIAYLALPWPKVQAGFKRALAKFAQTYHEDFLADAIHYVDAKSRLQEIIMQQKLPLPVYSCQVLANQQVQVKLVWQKESRVMVANSRKEGEAILAQQILAQYFEQGPKNKE